MTAVLTVSAVQYRALEGGIEANAQEHVRLIEDADSHGARLVIFPELSLTGYDLPLLQNPVYWLAPADDRLESVREICRRSGITAVVGAAVNNADGTRRLASVVLHPDGQTDIASKTHLHGDEQAIFTPGTGAAILELDGWKIALAICFDAAVPSHAGAAAELGADVYAVSAVYTEHEEQRLALHLGARTMDNRMFGILANLGGETSLGASCGLSGFWGPDGLAIRQAAGASTEVVTSVLQRSTLLPFRGAAA
ncbi:carbon-nitrogen hydrolase family protein [Pseudarthrobacter sp. N5]|uniref:carbon-nitrogen hydrolase family protein n=1 Tax=Pseudarthrobacter sp. N5 TaxID=3418416 RepID=UPI003CF883F2